MIRSLKVIRLLALCVGYFCGMPFFVRVYAEERLRGLMEEQQIQDFIRHASCDEQFRQKLASNPDEVIRGEGFSPRVAQVLLKLVPHLAFEQPLDFRGLQYW